MTGRQNKKKKKKKKFVHRIIKNEYESKNVNDCQLMNLSIDKGPSLMDYIPNDLIFSLISLKFSRRDYNLFKITSKTIYNKFKNDSWEEWESIDHGSSDIKDLIESGYRNFRINHIEFFVVNAKMKFLNYSHYKYGYALYTSDGKIISIHCGNVSMTGKYYVPSFRIGEIQYLKKAYPFSAQSRSIKVYNN